MYSSAAPTGAADAFLAAAIACGDRPRFVLACLPGEPAADRFASDLEIVSAAVGANLRIAGLPPAQEGDKAASGLRLKAAGIARTWRSNPEPCVIVASYRAVSQCVPDFYPETFTLEPGCVPFGDFCRMAAKYGYERVPSVENEAEWSVRGGIVDIWPPGEEFPVRAEFFGDDLENLRHFSPSTQRSFEQVRKLEIPPLSSQKEESISWFDILPEGSAVLQVDWNSYPEVLDTGKAAVSICLGDPAPEGATPLALFTSSLPGFGELAAKDAHHPELFGAAKEKLEKHLESSRALGAAVVEAATLSGGFEIASPDGGGSAIVVAKSDRTFAKTRVRMRRRNVSAERRIDDFSDLEPGEYVVHQDYGVGRYLGSSEIAMDGKRIEVYTIEYAEGAKLHVPASQAFMVSRYVGIRGKEVKLHGIDGKKWQKDKEDAKSAIAELAQGLLETQAKRNIVPGYAYDIQCEGYEAFKAAFPYDETPDQQEAISAVENDLAASRPMDRLVCGDAGYGKTEVAMRAAYIAALNGRQTAVLAPTTVLAEQHFETFTSRFDGTPVRIESVSRFQSAATHKGTFDRLANGACDIVIGTHAILSDKIRFHDLGLIVIDEEQRFGVRHKEHLKKLKATADVLTLSATPIPRTLYMSMTGVRELSLLRTPPRERVAVEISIVRDADEPIRRAIEDELALGGQVFFLHNRVHSIEKVAKRLSRICPNARITLAHGQMDPRTLAARMREFERGRTDILLSTTIVESGIDIPRANTIIVDQADTFGLADLYQLRGRVGRSSRQGRAIFVLPASGAVASDARERLDALKRNGGLGAGFNLAMRDLELRGAGDLLGARQSGHIAAIGFSLYCQLLKRTISSMKGEKTYSIVDVKLNLDFIDFSPVESGPSVASIPYSYVEEDASRMSFMKRLAEASSPADIKAVESDLRDRFGPVPPETKRLLGLSRLKIACARRGIASVDVRGTRAYLRDAHGALLKVVDLPSGPADAKISALSRIG